VGHVRTTLGCRSSSGLGRGVSILLGGLLLAACASGDGESQGAAVTSAAPATAATTTGAAPSTLASTMQVRSTAFEQGGPIPKKHSCGDANVPPQLSWDGVPADAKALAVVVDDPGAANFVHWVVAGISPGTTSMAEGRLPAGARVLRDYLGPCPPGGTHTYRFTVYALSRIPDLRLGTDPRAAVEQIQAAAIARGELQGTFTAGS
jgi:Raf kinase inhibitor-like YbhB/YbcL family protein